MKFLSDREIKVMISFSQEKEIQKYWMNKVIEAHQWNKAVPMLNDEITITNIIKDD